MVINVHALQLSTYQFGDHLIDQNRKFLRGQTSDDQGPFGSLALDLIAYWIVYLDGDTSIIERCILNKF